MSLKFSIITPSFRQLEWLKLCAASIADQHPDVEVEHIIQDAGTGPELDEWITQNTSAKLFVEKDNGMYDAVNRGLRRASGDILAYLNCDEQYLPETLKNVESFFETHPEIDVVIGNFIIVDTDGNFLAARKGLIPNKLHTLLHYLAAATCTIFFRKKVIEKYGISFNTNLKDISDVLWVLECLDKKVPMATLGKFTSAFTITGVNRNQLKTAQEEKAAFASKIPFYLKILKPAVQIHHRFRKLLIGAYQIKPFDYQIYTFNNPNSRKKFTVKKVNPYWNFRSP